jgi:hypothetical protein
LVPPDLSVKVCESKDTEMPDGALDVSVRVPLKPLTLVRVIVELCEPPCAMVRNDGEAKMLKSGIWIVEGVTLTVR